MFKSLAFDFKFYILQRFNILANQLHVNHKSHVFQSIITMLSTNILKLFHSFVHVSHSSAHVSHLFIQQLHLKT